MAVDKLLANFPIYINTGTEETPIWTRIRGISEVSPSPSSNTVDGRDFESGLWAEPMISGRGLSFSVTGFRMEDETTGARDPGQEAVEASGLLGGQAGREQYQIQGSGGKTITFTANAEVTDFGGSQDDLASWECTLTCVGAPVYA